MLRRVTAMLPLLACAACIDPACRELRGAKYQTVETFGTRGCEPPDDCAHHLRLEFHPDGTYWLDLDDTDSGGSYTCKDGKIDLGSEVFSAELSGDRLIFHGPSTTTEYRRVN